MADVILLGNSGTLKSIRIKTSGSTHAGWIAEVW